MLLYLHFTQKTTFLFIQIKRIDMSNSTLNRSTSPQKNFKLNKILLALFALNIAPAVLSEPVIIPTETGLSVIEKHMDNAGFVFGLIKRDEEGNFFDHYLAKENIKIDIDNSQNEVNTSQTFGVLYLVTGELPDKAQVTSTFGNKNTSLTNISTIGKGITYGVAALGKKNKNGPNLTFEGKKLEINVNSLNNYAMGINVQNNTFGQNGYAPATVIINAEDTLINAKSTLKFNEKDQDNYAIAMSVFSQGVLEINGNLEVHADTLLSTRGDAITRINKKNDPSKLIKLHGDIHFNYDKQTSGTPIVADVAINLANDSSYWKGNSLISGTNIPAGYDELNSFKLGLANGAQWLTDKSSIVNELTINNGVINMTGDNTQTVKIERITGPAGTVNILVSQQGDLLETGKLAILSSGNLPHAVDKTKLTFNYLGLNADQLAHDPKLLDKLVLNTSAPEGQDPTITAEISEGLLAGKLSAELENHLTGNKVKRIHQSNSTRTLDYIRHISALSAFAWRQENNTLHQRLGELRNMSSSDGVWARVSGNKLKLQDDYSNTNTAVQVGYDKAIGDWHYGFALSHNRGKTDVTAGTAKNKDTSLSLYATWLSQDGLYSDIVLRQGYLSNDYTYDVEAGKTVADYHTWGVSLSGEVGKKIAFNNQWYITPQAQLSSFFINGKNYTTENGLHVSQDTYKTTVGRLGVQLGRNIKENSDIYLKVSWLHDFSNNLSGQVARENVSKRFEARSDRAWLETGLGINHKLSKTSHVYADVSQMSGKHLKSPWQWNVGMRVEF